MNRFVSAAAIALAAGTSASAWALGPGDEVRGDQVYVRCMACHSLASDRVGPRHCGLFGRLAGSVAGFEYSPAMKNSRIVWNDKTLDRFLSDPASMVPGTTMTYAGIPNPQERADLIAYLKHANGTSECASSQQAGAH